MVQFLSPTLMWSSVFLLVVLWFAYTRIKGAEYAPTTRKRSLKMIEMAKITNKDTVYELGSGLGGLCFLASEKAKKVIGIEFDPIRVLITKLRIKIRGIKNVNIIRGDIFNHDISDADVILLFLNAKTNNRLRSKLGKLRKGTRVISNTWRFDGWKEKGIDKKLEINRYIIGLSN